MKRPSVVKRLLVLVVMGGALLGLRWFWQIMQSDLMQLQYLVLSAPAVEVSPSTPEPVAAQPETVAVPEPEPEPVAAQPEPVAEAPNEMLWAAPFTSQAPYMVWDAFHEETCEEASLLIAQAWRASDTRQQLPADEAEAGLYAMAEWERNVFGTDVSTTVAQMHQTATDYLSIPSDKVTRHMVNSISDLKELINQGVVVAPFAGRLLGNPNFTGEGPRYHVLVIIGYTPQEFITHDLGTRKGEGYRYRNTVLWSALHDYVPEPADITTGAKEVLLFTR